MFKYVLSLLILPSVALPLAAQTTVSTPVVGFVNLNVAAGTGTTKKLTYLSMPLLESPSVTGQTSGQITGLSSTTLSNTNAGWVVGELSQPASPCAIYLTSGAATGRMFLIASSASTGGANGGAGSANTTTTVTISSLDTASGNDPISAGVAVGDSYRIVVVDTLANVFGTPATSGILGGTTATAADTIIVIANGNANNYFYSTSSNRWTRVAAGNPDASNTPLLPYYGVIFSRLSSTALTFQVAGSVPNLARKTQIKSSGLTALAQFWPADSTLSTLGLEGLSGWTSGASATISDNVILVSSGTASTYWHDGTNWRRVAAGSPISDATVIQPGAMIYINKRGTTSGYSTLSQSTPCSL